jgi:hypothetical protein
MKEKWIKIFRSMLQKAGIDASCYSNEEVIKIAKGIMAPDLCEKFNIKYEWQFELSWGSLLCMDPDVVLEGVGIDIDLFQENAKQNKN